MRKSRYCVISIDVEPDCDIQWKRSNPLSFNSVLYGIPEILRPIWNKYSVKPVYFVSPEVVENNKCCEILRREIKSGAEIGSHLHPEYIEPEKRYQKYDGTISNEYPCCAYSQEIEFEKIKNLTELITRKIGIKPVSYRAGRYGADVDTINSLVKLGYLVDSSVTSHINWSRQNGPNFKDYPEQPYFIDLNNFQKKDKNSKILEVPITIGGKRLSLLPEKWFFYKWLRPTLMTVFEMRRLVDEYIRKYQNEKFIVFCLMFHSMEIIPKATPYNRSDLGVKLFTVRLRKIIRYLKVIGSQFETLNKIYEILLKQNEEF